MCQETQPGAQQRRLIVCIDGTADFAGRPPTHVFRLFRAVRRCEGQVAYYDGGVGTLLDSSVLFAPLRWLANKFDLAAGTSIRRNFESAYRFLAENYDPGDSDRPPSTILMFGFSRGAYACRALAGAIHLFGIPDKSKANVIPFIWQHLRSFGDSDDSHAARKLKSIPNSPLFWIQRTWYTWRAAVCSERWRKTRRIAGAFCRPARVKYLGLWDTVSSVGFIRLVTLPQTAKLDAADFVRHAVALHEMRNMFPANLIRPGTEGHEECWFSGVHRDVGGGGAQNKLALSMIPLKWVVDRAQEPDIGLELEPRGMKRLYEVPADAHGPDNQNYLMVAIYALIGLIPMRWWGQDRNWWAFWKPHGPGYTWRWPYLVNVRKPPKGALIHASVQERKAIPAGDTPETAERRM